MVSGAPAHVALAGRPRQRVEAWAGPWPLEERWWDPAGRRRCARFQLLTEAGAFLAVVEGGQWWVEAAYD
jgi:protein ImuB